MRGQARQAAAPPPGVGSFLTDALAEREENHIFFVGLPAPLAPPESLWPDAPGGTAVLWAPPSGPAIAGLGEALVLAPRGPARFARLAARVAELEEAVQVCRHPEAGAAIPSLVGGLAFTHSGADEGPWQAFGDTRFVLPRWTYVNAGKRAALALALAPGEAVNGERLASELRSIWRRLALAPPAAPRQHFLLPPVEDCEREAWERTVTAALDSITAGELGKVVLARSRLLTFPDGVDVRAHVAALAGEDDAYRFAFRFKGRTFLGASPELLVSRRGLAVASEALAGSAARSFAARGASRAGDELLADPKQRLEQQIVLDAVLRVLRPLCRSLDVPARPAVRTLRSLLHLWTPVRGRLALSVPAVELAGLLHPTPAVGGDPVAAAMRWLQRRESEPRGWFAGPVGRLSLDGDAELAVALRCALVAGASLRVYAGAGIVAGSSAEAELDETELKLRSALHALGFAP
jgi:isochorismate synthase